MFLKTIAAAAILSAAGVDAFWRMECPHRMGLGRIDPLMNPGTVAQHAHAIYGSNGFSVTSLFDELQSGNCTSCRVTQDKSAYWHPQLYFRDDETGEYEEVDPLGGMLAYYFLNGKDIQPFKPGFRMIAGDNTRRSFDVPWSSHQPDPEKSVWKAKGYVTQNILKQVAIGVNCLNYDKPGEPTLQRHYLPEKSYIDANCPNGIRFELMFPSCWVGGDVIDSPNHMDHVAYPDTVMDGNCPDDFPVRLPGLMFESFYNTAEFKDRSGAFVLSNGDTDGYGYHGDFISGWDEETLGQAVKQCTNESGRIEDCPVFNLQSEYETSQCDMVVPDVIADEDVMGPMPALPGGIQLGEFVGDIVAGVTDAIPDINVSTGKTLDAPGHNGAEEPTSQPSVEPKPTTVEPVSQEPTPAPAPEVSEPQVSALAAPIPDEPVSEPDSEVPASEPAPAEPAPEAPTSQPAPAEPTPEAPASQPAPAEPAPEVPASQPALAEPAPEAPESAPEEPVITEAPEPVAPEEELKIVRTDYVRNGNVLSKIVWVEELVYVTQTEDCTVTAEPPMAKRAHAHLRRHARRRHH